MVSREGFQLVLPEKSKALSLDRHQSIAAIPAESKNKEFFLSIGRNSHKLCLTSPEVTVTKYRPRYQQASDTPTVGEFCVLKKLIALNPAKAFGPDGVPAWLLKENADLLAPVVTDILNCSYLEDRLP